MEVCSKLFRSTDSFLRISRFRRKLILSKKKANFIIYNQIVYWGILNIKNCWKVISLNGRCRFRNAETLVRTQSKWIGLSRLIRKEAVINSYFLDMPKQTITIFNRCLVYPSFLYDTSRLSCLPVDKPSVIT